MGTVSARGKGIHLTFRQQAVIRLVGEGLTNEEIGEELGIEKCTVCKHLANAFETLQVTDREQAFKRATDLDLL